jgi:hypothetical protein
VQPLAWIEYTADWRDAPMAFWVHAPLDLPAGQPWVAATRFDPPAPTPVRGCGYRLWCVAVEDRVLTFSSQAQMTEFVRVMSMRPLPTARRLCEVTPRGHGPNAHWLSRLPAALKSSKRRLQLVAFVDALRRGEVDVREGRPASV